MRILRKFDQKCLDLIIPVTRPGDEYKVKIGCYLGEMTNEIEKDYGVDAKALDFVTTGPKSYGIRGINGDGSKFCVTKIKGFW